MKLLDLYREKMKEQGFDVNLQGYKIKINHYKLIALALSFLICTPNYIFIYLSQQSCVIQVNKLSVNGSVSNPLYFSCTFNVIIYLFATVIEIVVLSFIISKALKYRILKS